MRPVCCAALIGLFSSCGPPPATLTKIQTEVFAKSCAFTSCHLGSSPAGTLNLEGGTWAKLVGVGAFGLQGEVLVTPNKPESSYLFKKLTGKPPIAAMPPDQPLDAERLEMVRSWIADGAKNN